jgi:hypothetical protein
LIKGGVPFDVAWAMVECGMEEDVIAWIVIMGEIEGGEFDWRLMRWKDMDERGP